MSINSNEQFQAEIVTWLARTGGTVLVPTRRLAHALRHRMRCEQHSCGRKGWERPHVATLNEFIHRCWRDSWPLVRLAPTFERWRILHEITAELLPPDGLRRSVALAGQVDEAHYVLLRHNVNPADTTGMHTQLSAWRARVCARFAKALAERKAIHPASCPTAVAQLVTQSAIPIPKQILVAGLSLAAPIEQKLLSTLSNHTAVEHLPLPHGTPVNLSAVALPQKEQELFWIGQQTVAAAVKGTPLSKIAIVLPDPSEYLQPMTQMLNDLCGSSTGEGVYANIAIAQPLHQHPLVKSGLLLFELGHRPNREQLTEMLLSPYFSAWQPYRTQCAHADAIWRDAGMSTATLNQFRDAIIRRDTHIAKCFEIDDKPLAATLEPLIAATQQPTQTAQHWVRLLRAIWSQLGFPTIGNEGDRNAYNKLLQLLDALAVDLGDMHLDAETFRAWLEEALATEATSVSGHEHAGIQVLGMIESRGLCFERLFVPGMTASTLPRPVRTLPLLAPHEQRRVQGGSSTNERAFSAECVANMQACAENVSYTRPQQRGREPVAASLFWPTEHETSPETDIWKQPDPAWQNAAWIEQTWRGRLSPRTPLVDGVAAGMLPREMTVTAVESLLRCPLGFFVRHLLRLHPLDEPEPGIAAPRRGQVIHAILEHFVNTVRYTHVDLAANPTRGLDLLRESTDIAIAQQAHVRYQKQQINEHHIQSAQKNRRRIESVLHKSLVWEVERQRLIGDGDDHGLLGIWLTDQLSRWQQGWRFRAAEATFNDTPLANTALRIRGTVDRVDSNADGDLWIWDYKSGSAPSKRDVSQTFIYSQLVQYVAAAKSGAFDRCINTSDCASDGAETRSVTASFWQLNSEKHAGPKLDNHDASFWTDALERFTLLLQRIIHGAMSGQFPAEPAPGAPFDARAAQRVCEYCPARLFCGPIKHASGGCAPTQRTVP